MLALGLVLYIAPALLAFIDFLVDVSNRRG
jgi:hypothetical protein